MPVANSLKRLASRLRRNRSVDTASTPVVSDVSPIVPQPQSIAMPAQHDSQPQPMKEQPLESKGVVAPVKASRPDLDLQVRRCQALAECLKIAAKAFEGVEAWVPMVGTVLSLAEEAVKTIQQGHNLKESARIYLSHLLRLLELVIADLTSKARVKVRPDETMYALFEEFVKIVENGIPDLMDLIEMDNWDILYDLGQASDRLNSLERDIDNFVGMLEMQSMINTDNWQRDMLDAITRDQESTQKWANEVSQDMRSLTSAVQSCDERLKRLENNIGHHFENIEKALQAIRGSGNIDPVKQIRQDPVTKLYCFQDYRCETREEILAAMFRDIEWRSQRADVLMKLHGRYGKWRPGGLDSPKMMRTCKDNLDRSIELVKIDIKGVPSLSSSTSTAASERIRSPTMGANDTVPPAIVADDEGGKMEDVLKQSTRK